MLRARSNPFAMERLARELPFDPRWCGTDWTTLLSRLEYHEWWGLVAGIHGSGKSTFLDALAPRLEARGFRIERLILNDEKTRLTAADWDHLRHPTASARQTIWFLDGAERLGPLAWRKFRKASGAFGGLVITAHRSTSPRLPLLLNTRSTPEMLAAFVQQLAPEWPLPTPAEIAQLHQETHGNLREALWHCYDRVANEGPIQQGQVAD